MANINFTKANLEALPLPASGRAEYQDVKIPGLKIRVTPNNVKTFCVFKRIKSGPPLRTTLGRFPEMSIEQARKQAATVLSEIAEGKNPAEVKRALRAELTLDELFQVYLERHAKIHKKTANSDNLQYKLHLEKPLGKKKLSTIDRKIAASIHESISHAGHLTTANRVLALLSSVFNRAIEWGLTQTNPCDGIRRNREISRDRFLQPDELPRFFSALDNEPNHTIRDYVLISLFTGARRTNVLSMKWSELNLAEGTWRIPVTKNGTPQNVPLPKPAIELLNERRESFGKHEVFVFPGSGITGHLVEPKKAWAKILERANLTNVRIHDLRRTMGSWQAKTGASLSIIGKSLNHKSVQTTAIYARLDIDPVRESMNTATNAMLEAGRPKPPKRAKPLAVVVKKRQPTQNRR